MDSLLDKIDFEVIEGPLQEIEISYHYVKELISLKSDESDILATLQSRAVQGEHDQIVKGLLYGILAGEEWLKLLVLTSRDQLTAACTSLMLLIPRLKTKQRALWLVQQFLKINSPAFPDLFLKCLRTFDMTSLLKTEIEALCTHPSNLAPLIFYKILRVTAQQARDPHPSLIDYTAILTHIWRRRREACYSIGRDLVRVLAMLSDTNGIEHIWNDLSIAGRDNNPLYWCLLCTPTHSKIHAMLLNPSLEEKLMFVIEKAEGNTYIRYLKWIADTINETQLPDVVRFIVHYVPARESTPRWRVIGWFLSVSNDPMIQASVKQALIFDCLFFNSQQDSFYTIEPAMSLLKFSISRLPEVAEELLDFMLKSAEHYDKRSRPAIMRSLKETIQVATARGIFPSLDFITSHDKLNEDIRSRLAEVLNLPTNGEESVPSQIYEHEDASISASQTLIDRLGDIAISFANEPSIEGFKDLLKKANTISEELISLVLKVITHELISTPVTGSEPTTLNDIFHESETNPHCKEALKAMYNADGSLGVRLLIYCLTCDSVLYTEFEPKLERDLKAAMQDMSFETLNWLFPRIFGKYPALIHPNVIQIFLQVANTDLLFAVELDLARGKYSLLGDKLSAVLEKSAEFSSVEQLYIWKLISAELKHDRITEILDIIQKLLPLPLPNHSEILSGLLAFIRRNNEMLTSYHVKQLLQLPAKHFKQVVYVALMEVKAAYVEDAVLETLQRTHFHSQVNILKHLKYWTEEEGRLSSLVKTRALQEALTTTFQSLSTEYFKEFNCLLETSRQLYTI